MAAFACVAVAGLVRAAGSERVRRQLEPALASAASLLPGGPQRISQTGAYRTVAGDDWKSYASREELRRSAYFWWFDARDVYGFVDLVPDATFGRALRITFPANAGSPGSSPRMAQKVAPLDDMWLRWKMRFEPGWTTSGPDPAGSADSYKLAFFQWEGFDGRGELQFSNGTDYVTGVGVQERGGAYLPYLEMPLPGSAPDFGRVTTEWTDGEWWEYAIHYRKTGERSAVFQYWRRRLTRGGRIDPGGWTYHGMEMRGSPTPRVAKVELGANKNKNNPRDLHLFWGPWEVVDGSRHPDPFALPNAF
ncbi:MAG TPA: hypothetical protein VFE05_18465 [Longimicrobiaceae bacterium]|jgi:hypothetical protein|nr:hypothetical protein [Longimicrobiaceae bacterium]